MSICMPAVPRRFDLNSYPSFKPYVTRILSAEASLPASPYWASSLSAHAPCRTAAVCAAPNVHWTSDTSDHVGVDVQSVSIAQSQGLLEHFSVSSCGNFLLVGLDSS